MLFNQFYNLESAMQAEAAILLGKKLGKGARALDRHARGKAHSKAKRAGEKQWPTDGNSLFGYAHPWIWNRI